MRSFRTILTKAEKMLDRKLLAAAAIAALTVIVYSNSFTAPFQLDDFGSIVNNDAIRSPINLLEIWKFYSNRFILYLTFAINFSIHDTAPIGYHIVNTILHAFNGFVIFLIFKEILSLKHFAFRMAGRYKNTISVLAALIFVCHPIQVNAVTYIVQRTASLAACFYFLAIYFFIRFRKTDKIVYFFFTFIFTIVAMFTKENTITIPFMLLVTELMFFIKESTSSWKKRLLIFFLLFIAVPIIPGTNLVLKGYSQSDPNVTFKASTSMDRFEYFYTQMNVIVMYLRQLFIADWQNFDYSNDFKMSKTIWDNYAYISFLLLMFIGLSALFKARKNKLFSFGVLWFFIGLSVESSFISIKDVYFEHRLYFPLAGFIMAVFGLILNEKGKIKKRFWLASPSMIEAGVPDKKYAGGFITPIIYRYSIGKALPALLIVSVIMVSYYSVMTLRRNYIYSDSIRLWSDTVKKAPLSDRARSVLASSYMDAYEADKEKNADYLDIAIAEFKKAIELNYRNSTAHCNLSKAYLLKKDYDKCIEEARITLTISDSEYAYNNMGLAYDEMGKTQEAIKAYLEGYRINPKKTFILKALGNDYYKIGDLKNAKRYYEEFLKINIYADSKEIKKKVEEIDQKLQQNKSE